jgi:hypothetical protein
LNHSLHDAKAASGTVYSHRKHRRTQKEFFKKHFLLYRFFFCENLCHSAAEKCYLLRRDP